MNWYGACTLYLKEVKRFVKVYHQTLITPVISQLLLFFALIMASHHQAGEGADFKRFIVSGLIMMSMIQNSFANSSSSLIMSKVIGYITDILLPPLSSTGIVLAYCLAAATRGIMVGALLYAIFSLFIPLGVMHITHLIVIVIISNILLGLVGVLAGLISDTFDQNAAITNYLVTPFTFLSGTFYSVKKLPPLVMNINYFNPFFYIIDGFRYALIGVHEGSLQFGLAYLMLLTVLLFTLLVYLVNIGWKLKT